MYSNATNSALIEEFGSYMNSIRDGVMNILQGKGDLRATENVYPALLMCACRYKHWGFHEEREVRIISCLPVGADVVKEMNVRGINGKPRKGRIQLGTVIPYIELFEGITSSSERPLPIKRIIVGPHSDHSDRATRRRAVEILLKEQGIQARVSVSEIPYVG